MKKNNMKLVTLLTLTTLLFAGCGNTAADTENSATTESQATETVESVVEESTEPTVEETLETVEEIDESTEIATETSESESSGVSEERMAEILEAQEIINAELMASFEEMGISTSTPTTTESEESVESEVTEPIEEVMESEEEPSQEEVPLPEDRAWVDDLYNKLIALDYEAVIDIITSDDIVAKAEPYAYHEYVYGSTGYMLVTSDGKYVGLILSHDGGENVAFYSEAEDRDYGFMHTEAGDIVVSTWISTITGTEEYRFFDGTTAYFSDSNDTFTYSDGEIYAVWEM